MVQKYQRRLDTNKACARRYYEGHSKAILKKKLLVSVANGRIPRASTVQRLDISEDEMILAWKVYIVTQRDLGAKAREFHRKLTGEDWKPVEEIYCKCV